MNKWVDVKDPLGFEHRLLFEADGAVYGVENLAHMVEDQKHRPEVIQALIQYIFNNLEKGSVTLSSSDGKLSLTYTWTEVTTF